MGRKAKDIMEEKVKKIIAEQLNVSEDAIKPDASLTDDLGADSLDIFQIVVRLQEELNVTFDPAKVEKIETVEQALLLIKQTKSNG